MTFVYEEVVEVLERNSTGPITLPEKNQKSHSTYVAEGEKSVWSQVRKNSDTLIDTPGL
jgi:hypothetical protein